MLALDWNNGNRNVLADPLLTGLILGQTLQTKPEEIYRALIEATAFGAAKIIKRIEAYDVPIKDVITCGGLSVKNPLLMQIYADVLNKRILVSDIDQTCAFGAEIFDAVIAGPEKGGFAAVSEAQDALCVMKEKVYEPIAENYAVYIKLFALYEQLHDAFGQSGSSASLANVLKEFLQIKSEQV
ncbi:MAG: hypothetical protein MK193_13545 [Lentisphaeria bacterium]|nr:hypothetical protein [Lentisphaeria bacterium]